MSRWIYSGKHASRGNRHQPQRILERVKLQEVLYLNRNGTHCSLCVAESGAFSILTFRGTCHLDNWKSNLNFGPKMDHAHRGYEKAIDAVWTELEPALRNAPGQLYITGHSMGGALAALALRRMPAAAAYSFGAPPIGNRQLAANFEDLQLYRVVNYRDVVSRLPLGNIQVGTLCYLDHDYALRIDPELSAVRADQRRGPRPHTVQQDGSKLMSIPESLCDHAPQNYIANLEQLSLGKQLADHQIETSPLGFWAASREPLR